MTSVLKNIPEEDVLSLVKKQGPTIPARIVKEVGGDTFLIGAILSNLVNKGEIKMTNVKLGGTPFYYVPEHSSRLVELKKYLNEKDIKTFELLYQQKILKDEDQTPLVRVSLRNIKDFAVPIEVSKGDDDPILFWKFYTVDNNDIQSILKERYGKKDVTKEKSEQEKDKVIKKEKITEEIVEKAFENELIEEEQKKILEEEKNKLKSEKEIAKKDIKKERAVKREDFINKVMAHFKTKNIEVVETSIIRKGEIDFLVKIPTPIGTMEYFCKARDKKKISDGDVATAFIQGQQKKLPVLFLTNGELTKRTKEMLFKEFKGVMVNII
ncbi:MAG: hypothetical protein QXG00_02110 [Candidatus Woesearchaeota archaeon]